MFLLLDSSTVDFVLKLVAELEEEELGESILDMYVLYIHYRICKMSATKSDVAVIKHCKVLFKSDKNKYFLDKKCNLFQILK